MILVIKGYHQTAIDACNARELTPHTVVGCSKSGAVNPFVTVYVPDSAIDSIKYQEIARWFGDTSATLVPGFGYPFGTLLWFRDGEPTNRAYDHAAKTPDGKHARFNLPKDPEDSDNA